MNEDTLVFIILLILSVVSDVLREERLTVHSANVTTAGDVAEVRPGGDYARHVIA